MSRTLEQRPAPAGRPLSVRAVPPQRPGRPPQAPTRPPTARRVRLGADRHLADDVAAELLEARPVTDQAAPPLPDPTSMCCSVVRAAVEVLRGDRPAAQLARWVTPLVLDQLTERARLLRSAPAAAKQPVAAAGPVHVRRVRLERTGDTAEATVILEEAGRVRAAAVRLEARRNQWRIAVLELG